MNDKNNNKRTIYVIIAIILGTILIATLLWSGGILGKKPGVKSYSEFLTDIQNGKVDGVIFTDSYTIRVRLKDSEFTMEQFKDNEKYSDYTCIAAYRTDTVNDIRSIYAAQKKPEKKALTPCPI